MESGARVETGTGAGQSLRLGTTAGAPSVVQPQGGGLGARRCRRKMGGEPASLLESRLGARRREEGKRRHWSLSTGRRLSASAGASVQGRGWFMGGASVAAGPLGARRRQ